MEEIHPLRLSSYRRSVIDATLRPVSLGGAASGSLSGVRTFPEYHPFATERLTVTAESLPICSRGPLPDPYSRLAGIESRPTMAKPRQTPVGGGNGRIVSCV